MNTIQIVLLAMLTIQITLNFENARKQTPSVNTVGYKAYLLSPNPYLRANQTCHAVFIRLYKFFHMRYTLILIFFSLMFCVSSCASARKSQEKALQDWIQTAQRPIKVQKHSNYDFVSTTRGHACYTLIDRNGQLHFAKNVRFKLPAIIE